MLNDFSIKSKCTNSRQKKFLLKKKGMILITPLFKLIIILNYFLSSTSFLTASLPSIFSFTKYIPET